MSESRNIENIVMRAQQGEEAAFEELMEEYGRLAYYIAVQKMGSEADAMDVVQETFIEVRKSIKNLKEPRYFKAWLNRIVFSKVARFYEKRRDRVMNEGELQTIHKLQEQRIYMNPEKHIQFQTNKDILHHCIRKLKPIYQDVLLLQYFEECSMTEISEILGIPIGTVKSRLSFAKRELKMILEEFEEQEGIKLKFQSVGLEAFLCSTLAIRDPQSLYSPKHDYSKGKAILEKVQLHSFLVPIASVGVLVGGAAGLWGAYSNYQSKQEQTPVAENMRMQATETKQDPFPSVTYQGESVRTARKAYEILYDAAFSKEAQDTEELKSVYDTLKKYGGSYAFMADHILEYIVF